MPEMSGFVDRENKLICILSSLTDQQQHFTLAHEVGHSCMHREARLFRDMPGDMFRNDHQAIKEREANIFATELTMPERTVI